MKALFCRLLFVTGCWCLLPSAHADTLEATGLLMLAEKAGISMQQATAIVRRATGGRVVSASPTKKGGYKVRVVLDGGRVKTYKVDRNGRMN